LIRLQWTPFRPFLLRYTSGGKLFFWTWQWIIRRLFWTFLRWRLSYPRKWQPFSILWEEYHKWMIWCCWGSIQRSKRSFCFRRSTFTRRLLWWTFFLWKDMRRLNIFRVWGQRRTSCFWHRTFIRSIRGRSMLCIIRTLWRSMVQIRPWRSGDEGRESNSQPIFSNLSSTVLGISNSRWLLTWRQRPSGSNLHR
jgi:hypothetical protein